MNHLYQSHPTQDEAEVMWLVTIDGILRERALAPGISPSYPMDIGIDIQIDEASALDVAGVASSVSC